MIDRVKSARLEELRLLRNYASGSLRQDLDSLLHSEEALPGTALLDQPGDFCPSEVAVEDSHRMPTAPLMPQNRPESAFGLIAERQDPN
jgi:hypothetical protein